MSKPRTATEAVERLLGKTKTPALPTDGLDRHGAPGTPCYSCGCTERWRLGEGYPWVCPVCSPRGVAESSR